MPSQFLLDTESESFSELLETIYTKVQGVITRDNEILDSKGLPVYQVKNHSIMADSGLIGKVVEINSNSDMQEIMGWEPEDSIQILLIKTSDWRIIPIENLIAKFHRLGVKLGAWANSVEEIKLLENILELGVDQVVLKVTDTVRTDIEKYLAASASDKIELIDLEVESVERIGNGDRVCVDTCALLKKGEGLLIGVTSKLFALIQAEVEDSGYVNPRPFRVNAGPLSAYVLGGDKTNYLSELKAGSQVTVVSKTGETRKELVARVKIERRPMLLLRLKVNNTEAPLILQDAETVKLITSKGDSVSAGDLKKGDLIKGALKEFGRHFGMEVDEFIEER